MKTKYPRTPNSVPQLDVSHLHQAGLHGSGAKVAIIDAGFDVSVRGRAGAVQVKDFTAVDGTALDMTPNRHGTTVMGLVRRYAPMVALFGAKVGVSAMTLRSDWTIRALEWSWRQGVNVVNLSMGFPITGCLDGSCLVCRAVVALVSRGIVVVAAAGNRDPRDPSGQTVRCPAISEYALTVGALDRTGTSLAEYSVDTVPGRSKPDILAPGTVILADGSSQEGTSFAAPLVTASIALLGPHIGFREAEEVLKQSANKSIVTTSDAGMSGVLDLKMAWEVAQDAGTARGS